MSALTASAKVELRIRIRGLDRALRLSELQLTVVPLRTPALFTPHRGVALSSARLQTPTKPLRHPPCQTKRVQPLAWESAGVSSRRMPGHGVCRGAPEWQRFSRPPSRWPAGSLLMTTEDWRGSRREGDLRPGASIAAKRKTCLVVLPQKQPHNTPVQVEAEGKCGPARGFLWRFCMSARLFFSALFCSFIPTAPLCARKVCKKKHISGAVSVTSSTTIFVCRQQLLSWTFLYTSIESLASWHRSAALLHSRGEKKKWGSFFFVFYSRVSGYEAKVRKPILGSDKHSHWNIPPGLMRVRLL